MSHSTLQNDRKPLFIHQITPTLKVPGLARLVLLALFRNALADLMLDLENRFLRGQIERI